MTGNLAGNIAWDIGAETFSNAFGGIGAGWVEGDWNLTSKQGAKLWDASVSLAWKYMETPMRVWLNQAQNLPPQTR